MIFNNKIPTDLFALEIRRLEAQRTIMFQDRNFNRVAMAKEVNLLKLLILKSCFLRNSPS